MRTLLSSREREIVFEAEIKGVELFAENSTTLMFVAGLAIALFALAFGWRALRATRDERGELALIKW